MVTPPWRNALLLPLLVLLAACAIRPYQGQQLAQAGFLDRVVVQEIGGITISAAVPDAEETEALTGLDLYAQGIQPVWLRVENNSPTRSRLALWSIDRDYFSPIEVAYMNRRPYSRQGYDAMQRWFYQNALPRFTESGGVSEGLVFTHLRPGTKGFNLTVFANKTAHDFTFFVPLPGFVPDFMEVDFTALYADSELRDLAVGELRPVLENELGCCATDASGELDGAPLNTVLIGTGQAVRRAMLRGEWDEMRSDDPRRIWAQAQNFQGRPPDAVFSKSRRDGDERIQLLLWMSPWQLQGTPVWVGTAAYLTVNHGLGGPAELDAMLRDVKFLRRFAQESVTADLDSAQRFLLQNIWYNGSLALTGNVRGMPPVTVDNPRVGFGGVAYFTDGFRLVAVLSEEPRALDETQFVYDVVLDELLSGENP